jgi:hypothetical protein
MESEARNWAQGVGDKRRRLFVPRHFHCASDLLEAAGVSLLEAFPDDAPSDEANAACDIGEASDDIGEASDDIGEALAVRGAPGARVHGRPLTLEETVRGAEEEVRRAMYAEVPPRVSSEILEAWLDTLRGCEKTRRRSRVLYVDVPEHLLSPLAAALDAATRLLVRCFDVSKDVAPELREGLRLQPVLGDIPEGACQVTCRAAPGALLTCAGDFRLANGDRIFAKDDGIVVLGQHVGDLLGKVTLLHPDDARRSALDFKILRRHALRLNFDAVTRTLDMEDLPEWLCPLRRDLFAPLRGQGVDLAAAASKLEQASAEICDGCSGCLSHLRTRGLGELLSLEPRQAVAALWSDERFCQTPGLQPQLPPELLLVSEVLRS